MSWERLLAELDELEQQAAGAFAEERALEVAERARAAYAEVTLASRLMAGVGSDVLLAVPGVGELAGRLLRVGAGWCLLRVGGRRWIVPIAAVAAVRGLPGNAVPREAWPVTAGLGLASVLRQLAETGEECEVRLRDGSSRIGIPGRVAADFVELAGAGRERPDVVALAAVAGVCSAEV